LAVTQAWSEHDVMGMHPGWVATSGLLDALPGFSKFIGKRLRTAAAGADTIIWQCLTKGQLKSGGFYFDRRLVSPYLTKSYDPSAEERKQLLDLLEHTAGLVT
jgi:dehydrogenase/reductase SDR family protein 12